MENQNFGNFSDLLKTLQDVIEKEEDQNMTPKSPHQNNEKEFFDLYNSNHDSNINSPFINQKSSDLVDTNVDIPSSGEKTTNPNKESEILTNILSKSINSWLNKDGKPLMENVIEKVIKNSIKNEDLLTKYLPDADKSKISDEIVHSLLDSSNFINQIKRDIFNRIDDQVIHKAMVNLLEQHIKIITQRLDNAIRSAIKNM